MENSMESPINSLPLERPQRVFNIPVVASVPVLHTTTSDNNAAVRNDSMFSRNNEDDSGTINTTAVTALLDYGINLFDREAETEASEDSVVSADYHYSKPPLKTTVNGKYVKKSKMFTKRKVTKEFSPYYGPSIAMRATKQKLPLPRISTGQQWMIQKEAVYTHRPAVSCILCQIKKKQCDSVPGNGRCSRCENFGEDMVCQFSESWYDYMSMDVNNEHYYYVFPAPCFDV